MKVIKIIFFLLCLTSCFNDFKSDNCSFNFSVKVGENISISLSEAESAVSSALIQDRNNRYALEIIIIEYSSGKEVFSYTGSEDNPVSKILSGRINSLVKIKEKNKIIKAIFVDSSGSNKEEILKNYALKLHQKLCK